MELGEKKQGLNNLIWSPDGSLIFGEADSGGIFVLGLREGKWKSILSSQHSFVAYDFILSPDGDQIVFISGDAFAKSEMWKISTDGV